MFSILELKHIYEQILDEDIDKGNFYRKIKDANILEDTGMRTDAQLVRLAVECGLAGL